MRFDTYSAPAETDNFEPLNRELDNLMSNYNH